MPRIRLLIAADTSLGPGKVALLEAVARSGSISAAARELGMSYRRAWMLVDSINHAFDAPLVATATGLASWAFGAPFLTSTFGYVTWPVVGKFELASAMLFDLGIYLAVVGVVMVIISRLGGLAGPSSGASREGQ